MLTTPSPVPVTVLTGFLGAGKTTLLNHILTSAHGKKYAVIVNEFGEAGIDDKLLTAKVDEETFEMNNGCICCTVRGDLIRIINLLLKKATRFDGILIETTGLANPAPVAQTFVADTGLRNRVQLDSILTVVDAVHARAQLAEHPEMPEQVAFADTLLLNKVDAAPPEEVEKLKAVLRALNPTALITTATRGQPEISLETILNRSAFSLENTLKINADFLDPNRPHEHDSTISSLVLRMDNPLNPQRFDDWMSNLLATRGADLLRIKGILHIADEPNRYVFQSVRMMSEGQFTAPWAENEPRSSTLVIIGKNMDKQSLKQGFYDCASA